MKDQQPHLRIDPDLLFDDALTDADLRVYLYLLWKIGRNHTCWPTQETIGNDLNRSAKSVARSIERLREAKKITTKRLGWGIKSLLHYALPEQTDVSILPSTERTDLSTLDALEQTDLSAPERTDLGYRTSTSTEELEKNKTLLSHVPIGTPDLPEPKKPKVNGQKKTTAWKSSAHADAIDALLTWHQEHHPSPSRQTPAQRDRAGDVLEKILRIDMESAPDGPDRLRRLVEWSAQDEFWQINMLSLAGLRDDKKHSGSMKWEKIESRAMKDVKRHRQQQSNLEELEAANTRWEAAKRKAGLA
jgi:hypothetical protein